MLGIFTIGGGYAMISLLEDKICKKNAWLSEDDFLEIIAVAQALPGVLATNVSTFVGQKLAGKKGAAVATFGVTLPSFLIISMLFPFLNASFNNKTLNKFYLGIQAGVIVLIFNSAMNLFKISIKSKFSLIIFSICILTMIVLNINPIFVIIFGFVMGYLTLYFDRGV